MRVDQIHWLAGLVEGEGSFCYHGTTPCLQLQMTDHDVVVHAAALMGVNPRKPWRCKGGNRKLVHAVVINGRRALGWMMTLYVLMGERRRTAIRAVLDRWKAQPYSTHASRGQRSRAHCHPDRVVTARGLCERCYMKWWRAKRRAPLA